MMPRTDAELCKRALAALAEEMTRRPVGVSRCGSTDNRGRDLGTGLGLKSHRTCHHKNALAFVNWLNGGMPPVKDAVAEPDEGTSVMTVFRCYALNREGRIIAADYIKSEDLAAAIDRGWRFVASQPPRHDAAAVGLEIWRGRDLLFAARSRSEDEGDRFGPSSCAA